MIEPGTLELRPPIEGESLDGYVAEITALNDLVQVRRISGHGGVDHGHRPTLSTADGAGLPALAELLEADVSELRHRSHPLLPGDPTRRSFFGTSVHRADIRTRVRRFSPAALARSPHHRALWQTRLPFDTETGDILVDRCPHPDCGAVQRWRHSVGVRYCDVCVTDLADAPTSQVREGLQRDLRDAVALIHPDPAERSAALGMLPIRLRELGGGLAFELILRLSTLADPECRWSRGSRCWDNDPHVLANAIVGAWRLAIGWPATVEARIAADLQRSEKRFSDGNRGATRRFLDLRGDRSLNPAIRKRIASLHDTMDVAGPMRVAIMETRMGLKEASKSIGLGTSPLVALRRSGKLRTVPMMRGSVIIPAFARAEIESVVRDIGRRAAPTRAATLLGMPVYGSDQLIAAGHLVPLAHPFHEARYGDPQTTTCAVRELEEALAGQATGTATATTSLRQAARVFGGGLKPWAAVVEALITGEIPFDLRDGSLPLSRRLHVDLEAFRRAANGMHVVASGLPSGTMSRRDAGEVLNLAPQEYTDIIRQFAGDGSGPVAIQDVVAIARASVAAIELAVRTGLPLKRVGRLLAADGIRRQSSAGYDRATAEEALATWLV